MEVGLKNSIESFVILGTGGFAFEFSNLLVENNYNIKGFIGDEPQRSLLGDWLGNDSIIDDLDCRTVFFVAVGDGVLRKKLIENLIKKEKKVGSFYHSSAYISDCTRIMTGAIVYPNASIYAGASLGKGVLVNSNATIGHETIIGSYSTVGPGVNVAGCCNIGEMVYFGIGSQIKDNISICNNAIVGAGATVVTNLTSPDVYVGTPAKQK